MVFGRAMRCALQPVRDGLPFDAREVPGGDLWQIFVTDPNGVMIELNYETAKEQV